MFSYPNIDAVTLKKKRRLKKALLADGSPRIKKNIAVLGGSTTNDITDMLELFLLDNGIEGAFYQSEYGRYWQDSVFPSEKLLEFAPDIIFIHTTNRNILKYPTVKNTAEEINAMFGEQMAHFTDMWESLAEKFNCPIIQNNFDLPFFRLLGNSDFSMTGGRVNYINRLNAAFADYADKTANFYIHDINYISACYGLEKWSNPLYWNLYKYALAVSAIPEFSFNLANIIKSLFGKNKKAFALDLDNTLWGGVVGDDGAEKIELGKEFPMGAAYSEFQEYIKAHKDLGVVLTVCSKNDYENAVKGLCHSGGALKPEDFMLIKANWENKDENIREIASSLSIFPESVVFVDDNPAERAIVREQLGVEAPELYSVENYISVIDRNGYFEVTNFSEDDVNRNEMYMQNNLRKEYSAKFTDYGEYLNSLEMTASITAFAREDLTRITQLVNKSNQFNLTTKRYGAPEIEKISESREYLTLSGRLSDKFGDNGIVSVIIGRKDGEELHIELWLMSCRVLKREMELAMLDKLAEEAAAAGIKTLVGYYYPSGKNEMVRELLSGFGFGKKSADNLGNTVWELELTGYKAKTKHINYK